MPLKYDDIPGSWGPQSENWPFIEGTDTEIHRAFIACAIWKVVPYGSYVRSGNRLRVETEELKSKLVEHLAAERSRT